MTLLARIDKRKKAKEKFNEIVNEIKNVFIIHYSCESFYERFDGTSPRITSIAIKNIDTSQTISFSIHQIAEINKFKLTEINGHFDELEKEMLDKFYSYIEHNSKAKWVHWNMRNMNYGFEALAHRYRVLGGEPEEIHQSQLYDFSRLLIDYFGINYVEHPRLEKLVQKNSITNLNFLSGAEEALAFDNKDYVKLHLSTLRKVDILSTILGRLLDGSLKTDAKLKDIYGNWLAYMIQLFSEHWIFALLGGILTIGGIIQLIWDIF